MPYPASSYPEGVDLTIIAGNQLHQVINGEANEVVSTTSGDIPSVRKALADSMMFKVPIDWVQGEVTTDPLETRLYNGQPYWAPEATLTNPITLGTSPVATTDWLLAPQGYRNDYNLGKYQAGILISDNLEYVVYDGKSYFATNPPYTTTATTPDADGNLFISEYTTFENVANKIGNKNELSNSNFLTPSPDAITHPNATPESYVAGTQIFSGVYVGDSGCTVTFIDGRVNCTAGDYQFKLPNTGGLERVPAFTSSVSDYDGIPKTTGVSHALVGDEYVVTVTPAAGDVFSVKFEQGSVATRHEVDYGVISTGSTTPRTTADRFSDSVNPKDFGADGSDATAAIQLALSFAAENGKKVIISEPHIFSSTLSMVSEGPIDIEFIGDGELICSNSSLDYGLWISGLPFVADQAVYWDVTQRSSPITILNDIAQYSRDITLDSGHGLSKGDWVRIGSTDAHTPLRSQYRKGELHQIQEVNGDVISLDSATFDSYIAANTWVFATPMPSVRLINPRVTGLDDENDTRGVALWECSNVLVETPSVNGFNDNGLSVTFCADVKIEKPSINFSTKSYIGASRTSYGLVINSSQSVNVTGGTLKGGRHSFSMGGYDPNRFIKVDGVTIMANDVDDLDVAAMDAHENVVGLDVVNCTIYGGANLAGQDIRFKDNNVVISGEVLRAVEFRPAITCDYIIADGNTVNTTEECAGGVVIRHYADNVAIRKVSTSNNVVVLNSIYARIGVGFEPVQPNGQKVELWECRGNQISVFSTNVGASCLSNWDSADLADRVDFSVANIKDNYLFNDNGQCLDLRQKTETRIGNLNVTDNTMVSRNAAPVGLLYFDKVNYHNNDASGNDTSKYNEIRFVNELKWSNSIVANSDYRGMRLRDVDVVTESNITRVGCIDTGTEYNNTVSPTASHWGVYDSATDQALAAYRCTISQSGAVGRYLVQWSIDDRHSNEFFTMQATPHFDGRAFTVPNNYISCFVFLLDSGGSPIAGDFSFVSF